MGPFAALPRGLTQILEAVRCFERDLIIPIVASDWFMLARKLNQGRDGAGKGGIIKAITAMVSPRVFRVVALIAPPQPSAKIADVNSAIFAALAIWRRSRDLRPQLV